MILESYKVIDDYVVINDRFYYKLDSLHRLYLEDTYFKVSKKDWIGDWFSLNGFEGDIEDVISFIKDTNKLIRNAKSEDYLVIEWGYLWFYHVVCYGVFLFCWNVVSECVTWVGLLIL